MKKLSKEDFEVGMKVVPHDKTTGGWTFDECYCWNVDGGKEQGFLYVIRVDEHFLVLNSRKDDKDGNHYNFSDVTIYDEKPKIKKSELLERIEALEKVVFEEKPKIEVGQIGLFWDGDFDEEVKNGDIYLGVLQAISSGEPKYQLQHRNHYDSCYYEHFKPINLD